MKTKKSPSQRLGLERMELTTSSCIERASMLRKRIEAGKYKGELLDLARRWASWYASKGNQLNKARAKAKVKAKKSISKRKNSVKRKAA